MDFHENSESVKMKKLNLTATLWEEECVWVAESLETGIASCKDTPQEALSNLKEALELYLENARLLGIRDDLDAALTSTHKFTTLIEVSA
ncbi:MAG TPA: type II toxin-antitoxin system HicB family antitoxin [Methanothrix sp.]|nr:type II toxin-antitoxin system HicB family antitoxin [Methanothrix sp.]